MLRFFKHPEYKYVICYEKYRLSSPNIVYPEEQVPEVGGSHQQEGTSRR